jgi:outer membrane protein
MLHHVKLFTKFNAILHLTSALCLVLNFFIVSELRTQNKAQAISLTLQEAIYRALSYNNQLRASEFAISRASWDKKYALSLFLPRLSFNTRFSRIDDQTFFERDFRQFLPPEIASSIPQTVFQQSFFSSFDVSMPLFNSALWNGLSIAKANEAMAKKMNKSNRENLLFQVIRSYLDILKNQEIVALQKDYLELSLMNFKKAERLYNAGRYSKAEVLRWKVDYQQQKSIVVNGENSLRSATTVLRRLLNYNLTDFFTVQAHIPEHLVAESDKLYQFSEDQIFQLIQLTNQELIAANAALAAIQSNKKITNLIYKNSYTNYMPTLSFDYSYGWRENKTLNFDDYSPTLLMISFNWPLFSGFQNYSTIKSRYYDFKQSQEKFHNEIQNTRFILTETVNKLINLKTQRELSEAEVEFNEHNYRIVEQQKNQGLISNIDFIDAKLNLQGAKLKAINTDYDFMTAMVELYYLLGKIESLIEPEKEQP